MLKIKVIKILKYSYHENTLPWKNISYPGPYQFNNTGILPVLGKSLTFVKNLWGSFPF
jgi:hypothetical protein